MDKDNNYPAYIRNIGVLTRNILPILRPAAYMSDVGETLRPFTKINKPIITPKFIKMMYGISIGYVLLDTGVKTHKRWEETNGDIKKTGITCLDISLWHTSASMVLPGLTIHSIVKYSGKMIEKTIKTKTMPIKLLPTLIGLLSIPFIIHPLDHLTDYIMDMTSRKIYGEYL